MIGRDVVAVMGIDAMNKRGGDSVLYYLVMVGDHYTTCSKVDEVKRPLDGETETCVTNFCFRRLK
jgi:hypothetical protein